MADWPVLATIDSSAVREWWERWPDANVGIATGGTSALLVLDVDPRHGGDDSLAKLESSNGPMPATVTVRTGGGGRHFYFRPPIGAHLRNRANLRPGLDIRGEGGLVVAPPSLHASGNRYEWLTGLADSEVAEVPPWLLALLDCRPSEPLASTAAVESGVIGEGRRNAALTSLAGTMRRPGFQEPEIRAALLEVNRRRCKPPLEDEEVHRIAGSVARYPKDASGAVLIALDRVRRESVTWLVEDRLPLGKLALLVGDPGLGKSLLGLSFAAAVSRGAAWPTGEGKPSLKRSSILLSAEDDIADTIAPRLAAAGADLSRIKVLQAIRHQGTERPFSLQRDLDELEKAIDEMGDVGLVLIDPISAYTGGTDTHKNADVRCLLSPLAALASRRRVAVLGITHLNKGTGGPAVYRATGSLAFTAAARMVFAVAKDGDNSTRRLLLPVKSNLSSEVPGLAYSVLEDIVHKQPVLSWEAGTVQRTADEVLATQPVGAEERGARAEAKEFLRSLLRDGPVPVKHVLRQAKDAGISEKTLRRAKDELGVPTLKSTSSFEGNWSWSLPREDGHRPSTSTLAIFGARDHLGPDDAGDRDAGTAQGRQEPKTAMPEQVAVFDAEMNPADRLSHCVDGHRVSTVDWEAFEERAGILEYEAGFPRDEAERRAAASISTPDRSVSGNRNPFCEATDSELSLAGQA